MAQTVKEVADELKRIERELPRTDGVKWFAWLYADVTRAMVKLFDDGQLEAPEFMADLVVRFGGAFAASVARPQSAAPAWRPLFERRHDRRVAPLQFAIAGFNAHVGAELPVGLAAVAQERSIDLNDARAEHADWTKVNSTVAAVEPAAKRYLLTGAIKGLDPAFGHLDDLAATWSVEAAREAAWIQGRTVWTLRHVPALRGSYVATITRSTRMVCELMLLPTIA
jgi:Family of unknown function (DUF5995)